MSRWLRVLLAAAPGLVLAAFGLVHPGYLAPETAVAWWQLHVPLVVLFPLLAGAVWVLLRGVRGPLAVLARIAAYLYACLYIALDTVSGIAAGLATERLGDTPLVGDLFSVGDPLGHLGVACLAVATVLTAAARYRTDGPLVLPGTAVALVAAWGFYRFHLFSPYGVLSMLGYAVGFGLIAAAGRIGLVQTLPKGANAALAAGPVAVTVVAAAPVDISALLVTASGKVRSDDDFVFYNQPQAPGVRYRPDGVDVDPGAVEAAIDKVIVTASLDGRGAATFGQLGGLRLDVAVAGTPSVSFTPDGLGAETALLCVEIYRRDAQWKVRAVGQGYANGLAGIATDYGITVDEDPEPAAPQQAAPQQAAAPAAPGKVNLDKGRVSLKKRETVSLVKTGAPPLRRVAMGLGWDPARGGRDIDLDASAITIDRRGRKSDSVWFMSKGAYGGAIEHSGDNLTGAGDGDVTTIEVDLSRLPADVVAVVFTVNSFRGQKFTEVARAYCRLLDRDSRAELVRFDLTDSEPRTGVIMSVLRRAGDAWEMTAIGEYHDGKTVRAMYTPAERTVAGLA